MSIKLQAKEIAKKAKIAGNEIANLKTELKNQILREIANNLRTKIPQILEANKEDVEEAKKNGLDNARIDRLTLDENRLQSLANAVDEIANLPDPIGKISYDVNRPTGLHIRRISTPIGVILAIYEARPNVTSDVAALCFKSGNAVILRSGRECFNSAKIIADIYRLTLEKFGVNPNCVSYVSDSNREYVTHLLKLDQYIDVVVPRGGKELIKAIMKNTKIAIFKHLDGNCHSYIHQKADLQKAIKIVENAKMRRTGICGATESLVIDKKIAQEFLPKIIDELQKYDCEIRGDVASQKIDSRIKKATKIDFYTEYLDKILSVKIVKNIGEAIFHINKHSSSHTEAIITEDAKATELFFGKINSAIVMHNASTQFADGGEFGLGGEVGISTGKLHARGPVGLEQLTIYKYLVESDCGLRP